MMMQMKRYCRLREPALGRVSPNNLDRFARVCDNFALLDARQSFSSDEFQAADNAWKESRSQVFEFVEKMFAVPARKQFLESGSGVSNEEESSTDPEKGTCLTAPKPILHPFSSFSPRSGAAQVFSKQSSWPAYAHYPCVQHALPASHTRWSSRRN